MWHVVLLALVLVTSWLSQGRARLSLAGMLLPGSLVVASLQYPTGLGELLTGLVFALGTGLAWCGVIPAPPRTQVATALGSGIAVGVSLFLARIATWVDPIAGALVFATAIYLAEVVGSRTSPFGEWGSIAHSQVRQSWALAVARAGPHAVTFVLALVSGSIGYAVFTGSSGAAAVAALTIGVVSLIWARRHRAYRADDGAFPGSKVAGLVERDPELFATYLVAFVNGTMRPDQWAAFERRSASSLDQLLLDTADAARDGARVVVWAEGAGLVTAAGHVTAIARAQKTARESACVLIASWLILDSADGLMSNVVTTITELGHVAATQTKQHPVPGAEADRTRKGAAEGAVVNTDIGRLSVAICFDADHQSTWARLRLDKIDVVAIPASDWPAIGSLHADMARLRSRSIGAAMIRPARSGSSQITDQQGRIVAAVDHRRVNTPGLSGHLKTRLVRTR